jgi:hypothetical protein
LETNSLKIIKLRWGHACANPIWLVSLLEMGNLDTEIDTHIQGESRDQGDRSPNQRIANLSANLQKQGEVGMEQILPRNPHCPEKRKLKLQSLNHPPRQLESVMALDSVFPRTDAPLSAQQPSVVCAHCSLPARNLLWLSDCFSIIPVLLRRSRTPRSTCGPCAVHGVLDPVLVHSALLSQRRLSQVPCQNPQQVLITFRCTVQVDYDGFYCSS